MTTALRLIGVLGSSENMPAGEAEDGLIVLKDMLESWSLNNLLIFKTTEETFDLPPSKDSITMGPGGDFDTSRPNGIRRITYEYAGNNDINMLEMSLDEWVNVQTKDVESSIPTKYYLNYTSQMVEIHMWPVPRGGRVKVYSMKNLADALTLDAEIVLPPGYNRAIKYNLAIDLAPEYGKALDGAVISVAQKSLAIIKSKNTKKRTLAADSALLGVRGRGFDYRIGE